MRQSTIYNRNIFNTSYRVISFFIHLLLLDIQRKKISLQFLQIYFSRISIYIANRCLRSWKIFAINVTRRDCSTFNDKNEKTRPFPSFFPSPLPPSPQPPINEEYHEARNYGRSWHETNAFDARNGFVIRWGRCCDASWQSGC